MFRGNLFLQNRFATRKLKVFHENFTFMSQSKKKRLGLALNMDILCDCN